MLGDPSQSLVPPVKSAATIKRLHIARFRGLEDLVWRPAAGVNVILGGGDAGKTTILDALGLLLSVSTVNVVSDTDYFDRKADATFVIEADFALPENTGVNHQSKQLFPWHWNGTDAVAPVAGEEMAFVPVFKVRVTGTADMDLSYECIQPNGDSEPFTVGLRRAIGIVRLGGDDRNDRDLRLVQGSALDRLLADRNLRSRLGLVFSGAALEDELKEDAKQSLAVLDEVFKQRALPSTLGLGVNIGQGQTLNALIALTAKHRDISLPLTSWGAGTRRLASLAIAGAWRDNAPITVVDEIERGLEPYRQRTVMQQLLATGNQVFITTHSATAIRAAEGASLWYLDSDGRVGSLDSPKTRAHQRRDPEAFLARLVVIAEGQTEVGFVKALLESLLSISLHDYGIYVSEAQGNDTALDLLSALQDAGLDFAGFVDNEGRSPSRWQALRDRLGALLMQWASGCVEDNVLGAVRDDDLLKFVADPTDERTGHRRHTLLQRLRLLRMDPALKADSVDAVSTLSGKDFRELIRLSMLGKIPAGAQVDASVESDLKASGKVWFKNRSGGTELFEKARALGCLPHLESDLLPFVNCIGARCGRSALASLG